VPEVLTRWGSKWGSKRGAPSSPHGRTSLAVLTALMLFATPVVAGDWEDGLAAANAGDFQKAFRLWEPLAKQGDVSAQHNLGRMYATGQGVSKDNAKAISWYHKAAEQGSVPSHTNLGLMYYDNIWDSKDPTDDLAKAFYWLSKAAEWGHPVAQYYLGEMYDIGRGVPMDSAEAFSWYSKAAEQEYTDAQISLAGFYEHGRGTPTDHEKAISLYLKAAEQGHWMALPQYALGVKYHLGFGVPMDLAKAIFWLSQAAEQGHVGAIEQLEKAKEQEATSQINGGNDILHWLESIGLEKYLEQFVSNDITLDILPDLTDANLREMGINSLGNRKRILKAIREGPIQMGTE